jgi:superfamily II DNA or RNA helicase
MILLYNFIILINHIMGKYPDIKDDNFYKKIDKIYDIHKIKKSNKTYDQWCYPKNFTLQHPQKFLSDFISPNTPYMGILVYHRIGSGKTCSAVQIAEKWKKYKRIIVVVPASLRGNFRNELRSPCAGNIYITEKERKDLIKLHPSDKKYIEIINKTDERIDEYYEIYSYNKFVELIDNEQLNLENAILIVDEIQNMISEEGSFYRSLYNAIHSAPKDLRIILLSATPMFDKPSELALTLNLLRLPKKIPTGKAFNAKFIKKTQKSDGIYNYDVKNMDLFKSYIKGYISYYLGAPSIVFPKTHIKYVKCIMDTFQYNAYKKVSEYEETYKDELANDFYIGSRMISNIVFPNKTIDKKGFEMLTKALIKKDLNKYSCKFAAIIEKIEKTNGKIFVYSNFKEYGGLASFIKILEAYGYNNYVKTGSGKKRFAIWTGDESEAVKNKIRNVYNRKENIKGSHIKLLLGSSSIKEGVTLLNVKQAHIIDGYWNWNKLKQIIGRVSRMCSHKELDENKRKVSVYLYIAVAPDPKIETVDEYMKNLAHEKDKLIQKFENAIMESAVDCSLNYNANTNMGEKEIICDK